MEGESIKINGIDTQAVNAQPTDMTGNIEGMRRENGEEGPVVESCVRHFVTQYRNAETSVPWFNQIVDHLQCKASNADFDSSFFHFSSGRSGNMESALSITTNLTNSTMALATQAIINHVMSFNDVNISLTWFTDHKWRSG